MPRALDRLRRLGTWALAVGLMGLAIHAIATPGLAAQGYGVPAPPGGAAWVRAAGVRDGVLALATVALLLRHPQALRVFVPAVLLLPVGDTAIVLAAGGGVIDALPHLLGTAGLAVLTALWWAPQRPAPGTS